MTDDAAKVLPEDDWDAYARRYEALQAQAARAPKKKGPSQCGNCGEWWSGSHHCTLWPKPIR